MNYTGLDQSLNDTLYITSQWVSEQVAKESFLVAIVIGNRCKWPVIRKGLTWQ